MPWATPGPLYSWIKLSGLCAVRRGIRPALPFPDPVLIISAALVHVAIGMPGQGDPWVFFQFFTQGSIPLTTMGARNTVPSRMARIGTVWDSSTFPFRSILLYPGRVGGDGGTFDGNTVLFRRVRSCRHVTWSSEPSSRWSRPRS